MTAPFITHWPERIGKTSLAAWNAKIRGLYTGILLLKEGGQWNLSRQLALLVTQSSAEENLGPHSIIGLPPRSAFSVHIYIYVCTEKKIYIYISSKLC